MYFAPVAAGAAMSYTVGSMGLNTFLLLSKLVATFYTAALAFILLVLLPIVLLTRIPLRRFLKADAAIESPEFFSRLDVSANATCVTSRFGLTFKK
jgi:Na+/H+-dicarboxylate symporter